VFPNATVGARAQVHGCAVLGNVPDGAVVRDTLVGSEGV
jgi:carbonic anhydrase/acetyltransferase-like protein (isoleucine patch superfamily)